MEASNIWHLFRLHGHQIVRQFAAPSVLFALSVCLLTMFGQHHLQAQNLKRHDNKKVHFGISLGFNSARFNLTHSNDFIYNDTIKVLESPSSLGFNVGIVSDLHLSKRASLRFIPTLIFAEKDLRYQEIGDDGLMETTKTLESIILDFPLLFKYKSDRFFDNFRFYGLAGLRVDWDLGSNSKARRATDIIKLNNIDVLAEYGLGLEFYFPLFIFSPEIKISHGLPNIFVPTPDLRYSDVIERLKSRYLTISFQFEG